MLVRKPVKPFTLRSKRIFGYLVIRLVCGTCGSKSRWGKPGNAAYWTYQHGHKSPRCFEYREEPFHD